MTWLLEVQPNPTPSLFGAYLQHFRHYFELKKCWIHVSPQQKCVICKIAFIAPSYIYRCYPTKMRYLRHPTRVRHLHNFCYCNQPVRMLLLPRSLLGRDVTIAAFVPLQWCIGRIHRTSSNPSVHNAYATLSGIIHIKVELLPIPETIASTCHDWLQRFLARVALN